MRPRTLYRLAVPLLAVGVVGNVALAFVVYSRLKSPMQYNIRVVENSAVPAAPQALSLTLPGDPLVSSNVHVVATEVHSSPSPPRVYSLPFVYFEADGRRGAWCNGKYVYIGDRHAYGVVTDIFPERIYLSNGDYIDNIRERIPTHDKSGIDNPSRH